MFVKSVDCSEPPLIRFPSVTFRRLMRPLMGARIWVYWIFNSAASRFAFAVSMAACEVLIRAFEDSIIASAAARLASACNFSLLLTSTSSCVVAFFRASCWMRLTRWSASVNSAAASARSACDCFSSDFDSASLALASSNLAWAAFISATNGRGSMIASRSPFLINWPSSKWVDCR